MTQAQNVAIESSQINSSGVLLTTGGGTGLSTVGTNGQVLTSNGTTLSWATPAASTTFQTSLSGLTPSTATSGTVTLAGTLGIASGGTGLTSFTAGQIHYGSFSQSANLFWDSTNNRLGVGTSSPLSGLQVLSGTNGGIITLGSTAVDSGSVSLAMYGATNVVSGNHRNTTSPVSQINLFPANLGTDSSGAIAFSVRNTSAVLNEAMRINPNGAITTTYQPSFFSSVAGGTYTAGQTFGGSLVTTPSQPSTRTASYSGGTFTAPVAGYYSFAFQVYDFNTAGANYQVYRNGSGYYPSDALQMIAGATMMAWAYIIYLNANDYVQMGLRSGSSSPSIYAGHSFWSGFLVG
jgi:hypothetical protein